MCYKCSTFLCKLSIEVSYANSFFRQSAKTQIGIFFHLQTISFFNRCIKLERIKMRLNTFILSGLLLLISAILLTSSLRCCYVEGSVKNDSQLDCKTKCGLSMEKATSWEVEHFDSEIGAQCRSFNSSLKTSSPSIIRVG